MAPSEAGGKPHLPRENEIVAGFREPDSVSSLLRMIYAAANQLAWETEF
jgi:hypothetical protein